MKAISRKVSLLMLIAAICFVCYALQHPELSFPWSNSVTYGFYILYTAGMLLLFAAPFQRK